MRKETAAGIDRSSLHAADRVAAFSRYTSTTGRRDRVYRAASNLLELCSSTRRTTFRVTPVYKLPSAQRRI